MARAPRPVLVTLEDGAPGSGLTDAQLRATPVPVQTTPAPAALGAQVSALSTPVVVATDQPAFPVVNPGDVITVTPVLAAATYTSGNVLFPAVALANAVRANGASAILQSVTVTDLDDTGSPMDLFITPLNQSLGWANSAPSITDANVAGMQYVGSIAAADYIDVGASRIASLKGIGLMVEAAAGSRALYLTAITRGTPTHTASGMQIQCGLVWL